MDLVTKDFAVLNGAPTEDYPHGSFEVILSAPTLDRDQEVIDSRAFEPLPAHITFDTDHSMTCDSVVGSGTPSYAEDGTLRVLGGYCQDERSQTIRQKVADGHIRTTSVTFMAADREKDEKGVVHVKRAELLNGTFTPVPSNREAVVLSAKSIVAKAAAQTVVGGVVPLAELRLEETPMRIIEETPETSVDVKDADGETRDVDPTAEAADVAAKAATQTAAAADEAMARIAVLEQSLDL